MNNKEFLEKVKTFGKIELLEADLVNIENDFVFVPINSQKKVYVHSAKNLFVEKNTITIKARKEECVSEELFFSTLIMNISEKAKLFFNPQIFIIINSYPAQISNKSICSYDFFILGD